MSDYKEMQDVIEVPSHAGVEGFITAMRKILKLPRVTHVEIDSRGKITVTRFARPEEPRKNIEVDFDSVSPGNLVRNMLLQELDLTGWDQASICISAMFSAAAADHMYPVGFVSGANTVLHEWHVRTTGVHLPPDVVYGLPLHRDRFIPDEALILVTAYASGAGLVDGQKAYKIAMPVRLNPQSHRSVVFRLDEGPQIDVGSPVIAAAVPTDSEVKKEDDVEVLP